MKSIFVVLSCSFIVSLAAWAQQAADEAAPARLESLDASHIDPFFANIVDEAQQIDRLLSGITDRESADRSAVQLEEKLAHMSTQLLALEQYPFLHDQDAEALKAHMATLTHVAQSYLAGMQRLSEVNAYGSETLLALFARYKIDGEKLSQLHADDMPHTRLYGELADSLEDLLYTLSQVKDAAAAAQALPRLEKLLVEINHLHDMLAQLVPPATDEQKEAVRPARERLQIISNDIKSAVDKLQAAQCYGNIELDAFLPRILQFTAV